jgi:hypothetical protein
MSAAPRGVAANSRSSVTRCGRRLVITSSARSASTSANESSSLVPSRARGVRVDSRSADAMRTVQEADRSKP